VVVEGILRDAYLEFSINKKRSIYNI